MLVVMTILMMVMIAMMVVMMMLMMIFGYLPLEGSCLLTFLHLDLMPWVCTRVVCQGCHF